MAIRIAFVGYDNDAVCAYLSDENAHDSADRARYYADIVEQLSEKADLTGVCSLTSDESYMDSVGSKLRLAGIPKTAEDRIDEDAAIALLERWGVNYLVLQVVSRKILAWAMRRNVRTLPVFSTDLNAKTAGGRFNLYLLGRLINKPRIPFIGVRSVATSETFRKAGIKADKIFPWGWPTEVDQQVHPSGDLALGHLIKRWIDSPRRPAQSIMRYSLAARDGAASKTAA